MLLSCRSPIIFNGDEPPRTEAEKLVRAQVKAVYVAHGYFGLIPTHFHPGFGNVSEDEIVARVVASW